ncbi:PROTEIN MAIN-LIKE 2 [Salix koriyanagi]|uniref:PROTEIN MAIN-LIKE 2 n=1 Tax=Salix koriyanagi TaxID=2511006 RepID=A0A9Q0X106_9ROSI|nr:PROTEIN MAIN-LIKE 2 [Salix koriyanagi]
MCQSKLKKARHGSDSFIHRITEKKMNKEYVLDGSSSDGELHSFVICLHASELVGLDCKDSYLPHRVAMQFGMDQDLPGVSVRCLISWWKDCMQADDSQRCIGENFKARNKFREDRSFTIGSDN